MDINFCSCGCPISPNITCRLDAIRKIPSFYSENNYNIIVQDVKEKVSEYSDFTLTLRNFKCLDNGYSASYDISIDDTIITTVTFSHPNICIPYCCIYFLNQLKSALEQAGFYSESDIVLNPCSRISFKRTA